MKSVVIVGAGGFGREVLEIFNDINVRSIRPGLGLAPKHLTSVIGKRATRDLVRGTPLSWELVE